MDLGNSIVSISLLKGRATSYMFVVKVAYLEIVFPESERNHTF